jgi:acetyl esterase
MVVPGNDPEVYRFPARCSAVHADAIDPQAKAALERQRFGIPHSRYGLKLLRAVGRLASKVQNWNPPDVGSTVDLSLPGPDEELSARLYQPAGDGPVPTVVFFHGGGYVFGDVETHDRLARLLTRSSGCALLSVEYRLAPEHPFPAAVEDAYAAVEWAASNRNQLGGGDGLAVAGDSAGGTLAAVASLMAAERDGPEIDYQALLYPGVGVEEDQDSVQDHAGVVLDEGDLRYFQRCYYGSEIHERNPYADPTNAGEGELADVPPATVVTAGFDPLRDGGKRFAEQLVRDGVDVTYRNYEALVHGFGTLRGVDAADEAVAELGRDLREAF